MHQVFMHPLYSKGDEELALDHIAEYMENNNIFEYNATNINHEKFYKAPLIVPREQTEQILKMQYGRNIILIGNILLTQDLFFKYYMNHMCKYLDILGIANFCSYFRPSSFTGQYIIHTYMTGKKTVPLRYWNPEIDWIDLSYSDNADTNLTHPLNNFYSASIDMYGITSDAFIKNIGIIYGMNIDRKDKSRPFNLSLKMLPALTPITMMKVVEAMHKYL